MAQTVLQYTLTEGGDPAGYSFSFDVDAATLAVAPNFAKIPTYHVETFQAVAAISYGADLKTLQLSENDVAGFPGSFNSGTNSQVFSSTIPLATAGAGGRVMPLLGGFQNSASFNPATSQSLFVSQLPTNIFVNAGQTYSNLLVGTGDATFVEPGGAVVPVAQSVGSPYGVGATVASGGNLVNNGGTVAQVTITAGGNEFNQLGTNTSAHVNAGGTLTVSGGVDASATVAGVEAVYGGTVSGATILQGGLLVELGGNLRATTVSGNLTELSGTDSGSIVVSGGALYLKGGTTTATTVTSGGSLFVSGGIDTGSVLGSGGLEYVTASGIAANTTVSSGGVLALQAGGTQALTTLMRGGVIDLLDVSYTSFINTSHGMIVESPVPGGREITLFTGAVAHSVGLAGTSSGIFLSADKSGGILITGA